MPTYAVGLYLEHGVLFQWNLKSFLVKFLKNSCIQSKFYMRHTCFGYMLMHYAYTCYLMQVPCRVDSPEECAKIIRE